MEMLQCRFILASLLVLSGCFSEASCQTVYTYTTKDAESLPCTITEQTPTVIWTEGVTGDPVSVLSYQSGSPPVIIKSTEEKYKNFNYTLEPTSLNLVIMDVEDEDGGVYGCAPFGLDPEQYQVTVEVIPRTFSLDCFVPPDVTCPVQGMNPTSELICVCAANGVRPGTLYLDIPDPHTVQQNESIENGVNLFDLSLKATVPVTESMTEVTCSVKGYITMEQIPSELITTNFTISPPTCTLDISFDQDCKGATLSCSCSAIPTDGESPSDSGIVFSYFNGAGDIIAGNTTHPFQINDIEAGVDLTYSCRGCNGLYYEESSYATESKVCTITTESTTEKSGSTTTKKPVSGGLTAGAIVGISLGVVAVIVVIVVVAVIMCKKGKDDSKPQNSSVTDVKVTATNSHTTNSEPAPAPVYGEIKKDRKKKSDKLDDNGAGPRGDPEIPAYGVVDKNRTKDPTPAPRSSMRDSKNPSNPKQDGPMEMQYADLDHGNKPPSDEVRKPKEEPTEYATVQSVIV